MGYLGLMKVEDAIKEVKNSMPEQDLTTQRAMATLLTHLENYIQLEEQGLLLRLPCKVGDTIWESDEHLPICLTECIVKRFGFDNAGELYCIYCAKDGMFEAKRYLDAFGDTLFITKEEAERRI